MSSAALFGGPTSGTGGSRNLVEFRAGKLNLKGRWVHPDLRKGLVYVYQSDDSLIHFCWKERKSDATAEDDFIIFPDDVEFKRVPQCTTGRVYLLKFRSSTRRFFFWMQEPREDRDEELCRKVNESLNRPPAARNSGSVATNALAALGGVADSSDLNNVLGGMSQADLMSLLSMGIGGGGGMGALANLGQSLRPPSSQLGPDSDPPSRVQSSPGGRMRTMPMSPESASSMRPITALPTTSTGSGATSATPTAGPESGGQFQLADLQSILSSIGSGNLLASTAEANAARQPDLMEVLSPEQLLPLIAEPSVQVRLLPHLPEGAELPRNATELEASVRSPQFRQAVQAFSSVFQSGQLGGVLSQFGLGERACAAAHSGDLHAFASALQEQQSAATPASDSAPIDSAATDKEAKEEKPMEEQISVSESNQEEKMDEN